MRVLARRRLGSALVLVAALSLPSSPGAVADPTSPESRPTAQDARAAADAAARDVDLLVDELEGDLAAQDAARAAVAGSVSQAIISDDIARDAAARAAGARARHARTVRALYTSGGPVAVFSSLLDAGSLDDLATRTRVAESLLVGAARDSDRVASASVEAARSAGDGADAADAQVAASEEVERATDAVEDALARARAALADLSAVAAGAEAREAADARAAAEVARRRVAEAERLVSLSRAAGGPSHAVTGSAIPDAFGALYVQAAAGCPGMRWTQLAAVGQVETRHGRNNGPSSAGAQGPMQFMPRTFAAYGVDGDGDGVADPWNPADAIHSAAHYLCSGGAGQGTPEAERRSLLRYNNAGWYVDLVQQAEAQIITASG